MCGCGCVGTSAEQIMPVKKADSKSATSGNLNVKVCPTCWQQP